MFLIETITCPLINIFNNIQHNLCLLLKNWSLSCLPRIKTNQIKTNRDDKSSIIKIVSCKKMFLIETIT